MNSEQNLKRVYESFSLAQKEMFYLIGVLIIKYSPSEVIPVLEALLVEAHRAYTRGIQQQQQPS